MPLVCNTLAVAWAIALLVNCSAALAQEPELNEDVQRLCPIMSPQLARQVAEKVKGQGACVVSCSGCGCKGGPGYRGPRGCIGWSQFISVCGPPPHAGCTRECAPVQPTCTGRAWVKEFAASLGLAVSFAAGEAKRKTSEPQIPEPIGPKPPVQ